MAMAGIDKLDQVAAVLGNEADLPTPEKTTYR